MFNGKVKCKVLNGSYYSEQIAPFRAIYILIRYIYPDIFVYLIFCKLKDLMPQCENTRSSMIIIINEEKNCYIQNSYGSFKLGNVHPQLSVLPDVFYLECGLIKGKIYQSKEKCLYQAFTPHLGSVCWSERACLNLTSGLDFH